MAMAVWFWLSEHRPGSRVTVGLFPGYSTQSLLLQPSQFGWPIISWNKFFCFIKNELHSLHRNSLANPTDVSSMLLPSNPTPYLFLIGSAHSH